MDNYINKFRSSLDTKGYVVCQPGSFHRANDIIAGIGKTFNVTEIKVCRSKRARLCSPGEMSLHTDHPDASYISWYCESRADSGGVSLLQDFEVIKKSLSRSVIENLRKVRIKVPLGDVGCEAMISSRGIYYADWLVSDESFCEYCGDIACFKEILNTLEPIEILLNIGDMLVVDNKRMLHGRSAFTEKTGRRLLVRNWIA